MMIELNAEDVRHVLDMMACVTDEVAFEPCGEGFSCIAMDPSKTCVCRCLVRSDATDMGRWAVRVSELSKAMRTKRVILDDSDGRLTVTSGRTVSRVPLLSAEDPPKFPELEYTATATILAQDLRGLVRTSDPKKVYYVRMTVDSDGVTMVADDDAGYGQTLTVPPEECIDIDGSAATALSLDHLTRLAKAVPSDAELTMAMADGYPVKVSLGGDGWRAELLCAPILTED